MNIKLTIGLKKEGDQYGIQLITDLEKVDDFEKFQQHVSAAINRSFEIVTGANPDFHQPTSPDKSAIIGVSEKNPESLT